MTEYLPRSWLKLPFSTFFVAKQHPVHPHRTLAQLLQPNPIHRVDPRFLSFSIDISVLAGGFWWEGSLRSSKGLGVLRIPPLNLKNEKLGILSAALQPAFLRVGGSEADKIHYFHHPKDEPDALVLTQSIWDDLHRFKQQHQFALVFTMKYGLFKRSQQGAWQQDDINILLQHAKQNNQTIDVCELGNELNAYWAFHGLASQPRAQHLATDYHRFIQTIKQTFPNCRIMGPGSAYWPKLGETIKPFSNITKRFLETCRDQDSPLDIIDWHYYPFQSRRSPVRTRTASLRNMLKPKAFNDFRLYNEQLKSWRDQYYPDAELWTGETGSAQCGGQPKLSDRFISCFWWADQLGLAARCGQSVMIRQSLIGGDYGLIDRLTLKPRPDYWLSWLWKQLMGQDVYDVQCNHHMIRSYCHNFIGGEGKILLLLNLSNKPIDVETAQLGEIRQQWSLTAKHLQSKKVRINGEKARYNKGQFQLSHFPSKPISSTLPGHSIHFWWVN